MAAVEIFGLLFVCLGLAAMVGGDPDRARR
jgi:hypothetical protein